MGHPSRTAKQGHLPSDDAVSKGINQDIGPYKTTKDVYCRQCGFICNLERDARNIDEFAGETISQGTLVTDHGYRTRAQRDTGDEYGGDERTTTTLSKELSNGSFEDWTVGALDYWTASGTTISKETTSGYFDDSDDGVASAKIVRSGSDISLSQVMSTPSDFNANTITFRVRVKSSANEVIRLRATVNSVNYDSSYNYAQQNFQELSVTVVCPAVVSSLTVYILADNANGTAYLDQAILARSGNTTTATVSAGCPHCGSYNYY